MSNGRTQNVIRVDTSAAYTDLKCIESIKYIGASSGTAAIYDGSDNSGIKLWEEAGTANVWNPEVDLGARDGVYVEVTNGAVLYLYLE